MAIDRGNFSDFLHRRRGALGRRWKRILADAYLSRATLHRIRNGDPHHPIAEVDSLRSLANALAFASWADLVAAFDADDPHAGLESGTLARSPQAAGVQEDALVSLSRALNLAPTELVRRLAIGASAEAPPESLPSGIHANELRPARLVPHFVSGIAASRRVEKLEDEDLDSRSPAAVDDLRVFSIPVDGDCQEPVWKNGEIVLFSFDAFEREGIVSGKSYYLAFTDGSTTFKRVFLDPQDPDVYVLRCWNTARYPGERRVHFDEVVRVARALCKQITPEE